MNIDWLKSFAEQWCAGDAQGRAPHAVLLAGPPGTGKRAAAAWLVRRKLALSDAPVPTFPFERPAHADLRWLEPPEDRTAILIEQVRALVEDLGLTSFKGHGKAAVIEPANRMTISAANGLLKTLEEPPGDALLVLVADRTDRLPATIVSRCQRVELPVPAERDALEWLGRMRPGFNWSEALRESGGGPLAAIAAAEQLETTRALARDFSAVAAGDASPVDIAQAWARLETGQVLDWLARTVQALIRAACGRPEPGSAAGIDQSVLQRMDLPNLFCYLDTINRLRSQSSGSFNVQLALEGLLIDWATGLTELGGGTGRDTLFMGQAGA